MGYTRGGAAAQGVSGYNIKAGVSAFHRPGQANVLIVRASAKIAYWYMLKQRKTKSSFLD